MLEEARLPLVDPSFFELEKKEENEVETKQRVVILDISPKSDNTIEL